MKVLMITGDKSFGPGHPRFELQKSAVEELAVVYWGAREPKPAFPPGPFDVVTSQDPFWRGLVALHAARKFKSKLNIQVHTDLSAQSSWRRLLARYTLQKADSVRVVSEKIKKQVEDMGARAKVSVLPVFVDLSKFKNIILAPHTQKTILWLGRFEDEKDPLLALDVLQQVRAAGVDAKLVMLGAGSLENSLCEKVSRFNLDKHVELPGWQDPVSYLEVADVVLCTSKHESWGASMVEALAAGVPVVAPDVGVAREAGAIVVPRERLAEEVVQMLQSSAPGELKLPLLSKEEWAERWVQSLNPIG